jgi:ABC-type multidrug transport system ATPase subunit
MTRAEAESAEGQPGSESEGNKPLFSRSEKRSGGARQRAQFLALLGKNFRLKVIGVLNVAHSTFITSGFRIIVCACVLHQTRGTLKAASVLEIILPAIFSLALCLPRILLSPESYNPELNPEFSLGSLQWSQTLPSGSRLRVAQQGISLNPGDGSSTPGSRDAAARLGTELWQRMFCHSYFNHTFPDPSSAPVLTNNDEDLIRTLAQQLADPSQPSVGALQNGFDIDNFALAVFAASTRRSDSLLPGDIINAFGLLNNASVVCSSICIDRNSDCHSDTWQPFLFGNTDTGSSPISIGFLDVSAKTQDDAVRDATKASISINGSGSSVSVSPTTLAVVSANVTPGRITPSYTLRTAGSPMEDFYENNFPPRWGAVSPPSEWTAVYTTANVQHALEQAIASIVTEKQVSVNAQLKQSPWVPYDLNTGSIIAAAFLGLLLAIAFSSSSVLILKSIVQEKELRLREGMRMMGMTDTAYWSTWFITHWSTLAGSSLLVSLIGIYFLKFTDPSVNLVFLLLWSANIIGFSYVISAFFDNARLASIAGWFIYLVSIAPGIAVATVDQTGDDSWLWTAIAPGSALYQWGQLLARLETTNRGLQWSNMTRNVVEQGTFTGAGLMSIVIVEAFIFFVLAWYLDNVWPSKYGQTKHPLFIFSQRFWFGSTGAVGGNLSTGLDSMNADTFKGVDGDDSRARSAEKSVEPITKNRREHAGIHIQNLCKTFSNGVRAVDDLNATFMRGEISTLLGHNGAGKTTAFSCMTGTLEPTRGDTLMNGLSVTTNLQKIREDMGVCPQFDTLWPMLTVQEHLRLYATFAGVPAHQVESEAARVATRVNLAGKMYDQAGNLSGGQRRKLSLGIAFIGSPSVVLLDEMSSGMDPSARRFAWDIIRSEKSETTILMTTHSLDEADALSDRIAIMSSGKIAACGSSHFLKSRFGSGYQLTVAKTTDSTPANPILQLVQARVPSATLASNVGAELSINMPKDSTPAFSGLISKLQQDGESIGISSYGLSYTNLEAVFLNLAKQGTFRGQSAERSRKRSSRDGQARMQEAVGSETTQQMPVQDSDDGHSDIKEQEDHVKIAGDRAAEGFYMGFDLWQRQLRAVAIKRLNIVKRDKVSMIFMLAVPLLFVLAALAIGELEEPTDSTYEPRTITREQLLDNFRPAYGLGESVDTSAAQNYLESYHYAFQPFRGEQPKPAPNPADIKSCMCFCPTSDQQGTTESFRTPRTCVTELKDKLNGSSTSIDPQNDCTITSEDGYTVRIDGMIGGESCKDGFDSSMDGFLLDQQEKLLPCNLESAKVCDAFYISDVSDSGVNATVIPNPSGYFGLLAELNELNSAEFVRKSSDEGDVRRIDGTLHPLPDVGEDVQDSEPDLLLLVALFITLGGGILTSTFSVFVSAEKTAHVKHLQMVSGVDKIAYWLANWVVDTITYLISFGFLMLVFGTFNSKLYGSSDALQAIAVTLLLFGWAAVPLAYLLHFPFQSEMNCFVGQLSVYFFFGFAFIISGIVLETIGQNDQTASDTWDVLEWFWRLLPQFCLGKSLHAIAKNELAGQSTIVTEGEGSVSLSSEDPFKDEITGNHLIFLAWEGFVLFALTLLYDLYGARIISMIRSYMMSSSVSAPEKEDDDVKAERNRVFNELHSDPRGSQMQDSVVLNDVKKVYPNGTEAVKGVTFGAESGRAFGLIGVNGAGKSTTFRTITGEFEPTSGDALVCSPDNKLLLSVVKDPETARKSMGYCPQFDALNSMMTVREHLRFYASVRGVHDEDIEQVAQSLIDRMHLRPYANRLAQNLSGGNKRKLCVAIALIGDPPVVLLDEPSTGVDPESRRFLWDVVLDFLPGRVVVLTSHSMEECEALCHKLGIMVSGSFRCMGGVQHIKNKYGTGYFAEFKVPPEQSELLKTFVSSMPLSGMSVTEEYEGRVKFHLHIDSSELSIVFDEVEKLRQKQQQSEQSSSDSSSQFSQLDIQEYNVSQPSLDDIFISFAQDA